MAVAPQAYGDAKHLVVLLDRSWEPTLQLAVDVIQEILHDVLRLHDRLGLATTGGDWLIELAGKSGREKQLTAKIQASCELSAGLALDRCISMCVDELVQAAAHEHASQWLLVLSDTQGGDPDSEESATAREELAAAEGVNLVFVNLRRVSRFYPSGDWRWDKPQSNAEAYIKAAGERGHEIQVTSASEMCKQVMKALAQIMPSAAPREATEEGTRHREHAVVLRELRRAMESHRTKHGGNMSQSTEKIFAALDRDGSGRLESRELQTAMRRIGFKLTAKQIEALSSALDHDGDGVDRAELAEFLHGPEIRAAKVAKERKEVEYRKRVEATHRQRAREEKLRVHEEEMRVAKAKRAAEREAERLKKEEAIRQKGFATMEAYAQKASFVLHHGEVPNMRARLDGAGASYGQINCSLHWENGVQASGLSGGADLDLVVKPPHDSEITASNREAGGGVLDVNRRENEEHPVENVVFEEAHPGRYVMKVSCRDGGATPKNFECVLLAAIPGRVHIKSILHGVALKETHELLEGAVMISGTIYGAGYLHAVVVCEFEVSEPEPEPPEPEPESPQFEEPEQESKPHGKELLTAFRDSTEVMQAMDRLGLRPSAMHVVMLGLGQKTKKERLLRAASMALGGAAVGARQTQGVQADNHYRQALREVSEQIQAQRRIAHLAEQREYDRRQIATPRVSGLPRARPETVRHRINNQLSLPHPRWASREGRPNEAVLQRSSVSSWDWGFHQKDDEDPAPADQQGGNQREARAIDSPLGGTGRHPACSDADAIFARVGAHITKEVILGRRPRSSPRRRQQQADHKGMAVRASASSASSSWLTVGLPTIGGAGGSR